MANWNQILIEEAKEILALYDKLIADGFKNKELAKTLGVYPSAFSSLINKVVKPLTQLKNNDVSLAEKVEFLFRQVNNISEIKTRQRLSGYIQKLQELGAPKSESVGEEDHKAAKHFIETLVNNSPMEVMKVLQGVYYCYYLSSFGYRIKREPLLISHSSASTSYIVKKGNNQSPARYQGFGYISNNHIFTIQIKELETLISDNFTAHFHLPPSYATTMNMLKGVSLSMSNGYLPISRKIILHRVSDKADLKLFNALKTIFYEEENSTTNTIVKYLQRTKMLIEYLPIPHPDYDVADLKKEEIVSRLGVVESA